MPVEITPITTTRNVPQQVVCDKLYVTRFNVSDESKSQPSLSATIAFYNQPTPQDDRLFATEQRTLNTRDMYAMMVRVSKPVDVDSGVFLEALQGGKAGLAFHMVLDFVGDWYAYVVDRETEATLYAEAETTARQQLAAANAEVAAKQAAVQVAQAQLQLANANNSGQSAAQAALTAAQSALTTAQNAVAPKQTELTAAGEKAQQARLAALDAANPPVQP